MLPFVSTTATGCTTNEPNVRRYMCWATRLDIATMRGSRCFAHEYIFGSS